jgi:hypothetical protein
LLVSLFFNCVATTLASTPTIYNPGWNIIQGNSLQSVSSPQIIKPIINADLLGCFIDVESLGNPEALNKYDLGGAAYGCLQFHADTFEGFCVDTYHLEDNIWDCKVQIQCADLMIQDGYVGLWGKRTLDMCLQLQKAI